MTEKTPPPLDPRFSPAFQRGFDPDDPGAAVAPPSALQARPAAQSPYAPPVASPSSFSLPGVSSPPGSPSAPLAPPSVTAPASAPTDGAQPSVVVTAGAMPVDPSLSASVRNPYLIALGVIAVALVAVGGWLFTRSSAAFDDPGNIASQGQYMSLQAAITVAPIFMLLGAATAIGVLFVFALRWRGKQL